MNIWNRWLFVLAVLSLAVVTAGNVEAAKPKKPKKSAPEPKPKTITQYVDTDVFRGEIQKIELQFSQITVTGKVVQQKRKVQIAAHADSPPTGQPSPTQTLRFSLATSCRLTLANQPNATMASLKVGDKVEVQFRPTGSTSLSAVAIATAVAPKPAPAADDGE